MTRQDYFSKVGVFIKPSSGEPDAGLEGAKQGRSLGGPRREKTQITCRNLETKKAGGNGDDALRKVCALIPDTGVRQNTLWSLRL